MNYKNLSPLTKKKEIQITKCGGLPDDRCPQISLIREKNSAKAKQKSIQNE